MRERYFPNGGGPAWRCTRHGCMGAHPAVTSAVLLSATPGIQTTPTTRPPYSLPGAGRPPHGCSADHVIHSPRVGRSRDPNATDQSGAPGKQPRHLNVYTPARMDDVKISYNSCGACINTIQYVYRPRFHAVVCSSGVLNSEAAVMHVFPDFFNQTYVHILVLACIYYVYDVLSLLGVLQVPVSVLYSRFVHCS